MTVEHNQNLEIRSPANDLIQKRPAGELPINVPITEGATHDSIVVQGPLGGEGDADSIEVVVDEKLEDLVQAALAQAQEHVRVADLRRGKGRE
jgi:hypothetical protein